MKLRISLEGKSYEVDVDVLPDAPESEASDSVPETVLQTPPPPPDTRAEDLICRSPIAGLIVAIAAQLHQSVRQDDPIVTIEAMKMQTTIGAPVAGTIAEINVAPGDAVKPGQVICRLA